jgi:uncharacterized protein
MVLAWVWTVAFAARLSVDEVPNPLDAGGWVTDLAGVLPDDREAALNDYLERVHRETGGEVAVVTVHDTIDEPKAFATGLFAHWGLGDAQANNGLLVLLVLDRRRVEMETGYGLETVLPDGWLGSMQAQHMVPSFKAGDYATGLEAGVKAAGERMRAHGGEVREGSGGAAPPGSGAVEQEAWILAGGAAGGLGLFGVGGWWWVRRRARTCPTCNVMMEMIPEHEDDEQLSEGEQFEEQIGSVDYQIYVCPTCSFSKTLRVTKWFSGYSDCRACGHRALASTSRTLQAATYDHGGLVEVTESCTWCDATRSYTRSTPRLQRSSSRRSSRSGGGGRSFGGGRSGGGGAGSSW